MICCQEGRLGGHASEGGREGSVDLQENPVLYCMSILSPVVDVVFLVVTAFHHFKYLQFFPTDSCSSFRAFV